MTRSTLSLPFSRPLCALLLGLFTAAMPAALHAATAAAPQLLKEARPTPTIRDGLPPQAAAPQSAQGVSGDFQIDLNFSFEGLSAENVNAARQAHLQAEAFFEHIITGRRYGGRIPDPTDPAFPMSAPIAALSIDVRTYPIDGPSGVLGQAGPSHVVRFRDATGMFSYATHGTMHFDSADVDRLLADALLDEVVLHEMAHVLGFGILWTPKYHDGAYAIYDPVAAPGRYVGRHALKAYRREFGTDATYIAVETGSGLGTTDHTHWAQKSELWLGGRNELMTGYVNAPIYMSDTTLHAFRDLGYTTLPALPKLSSAAPVPLPASGLLLGLAVATTLLGRHAAAARIARLSSAA